MEDLSAGFLEALENDMQRELEFSNISTGIIDNENGLAPMNDWAESNRQQRSGRPIVPASEFRIPRIKAPPTGSRGKVPIDAASVNQSLDASHQQIGGDSSSRGRKSTNRREFDPTSFNLPDWTLAKGWKNRPRKMTCNREAVMRDTARFRQRLYEARKVSGPGFRFGVHGDAAAHQTLTSYEDKSLGSSSQSTLRRLRHSSSTFNESTDLNSLSGPEKLSCIQFQVSMTKYQPTYNPADVQGILHRNRRSLPSPDVAARQASRAGNRTGPGSQPILVPNSSSPLASGKFITFSSCKRFPYDSDFVLRRPKTRDTTLVDDEDWDD